MPSKRASANDNKRRQKKNVSVLPTFFFCFFSEIQSFGLVRLSWMNNQLVRKWPSALPT